MKQRKRKFKPIKSKSMSNEDFFTLYEALQNGKSKKISYQTAANHGDIYTCCKILSTAIGQLPFLINRVDQTGTVLPVEDTVLSNIVAKQPCYYLNTQQWVEMCISCLCLRGNFYVEIIRNRYGNIAQLTPFVYQDGITVNMLSDGSIQYEYVNNSSRSVSV